MTKKQIKEEKATRGDKRPGNFKDLIKDTDLEPVPETYDDRYDKRAATFWKEMFGLIDLLNFNNKKYIIRSLESPILTNYLIWRMLNEMKGFRRDFKINNLNNEKIKKELGI